jgi:hypothetical protein
MPRRLALLLSLLAALLAASRVEAGCVIPVPPAERAEQVAAVCRARVEAQSFHRLNGVLHTLTRLTVLETIKGKFGEVVHVNHPGGADVGVIEQDSANPGLVPGNEYVLFLDRDIHGYLHCPAGGADAPLIAPNAAPPWLESLRVGAPHPGLDATTDAGAPILAQAVGGLLTIANGISSRWIAPDRGAPIPCLVDLQAMPPGQTTNSMLAIIGQAFAAWSNASSARFVIERITNLGFAAPLAPNDGRLRIQTHNLFNYITNASTLGRGGVGATYNLDFAFGGEGGRLGTQEFFSTSRGHVVLNHTNAVFLNTNTLAEILTHELGHALGLDHSSTTFGETNSYLATATMFAFAHGDGRGASLRSYDSNSIVRVNPRVPPPHFPGRIIDAVTASPQPNVAGINSVLLRAYSLNTGTLTYLITNASSSAGSFSVVSNLVSYTPSFAWSDASGDPADPNDPGFDNLYARATQGSNASPWANIRVMSFSRDNFPATSDGIPDNWMVANFGSANPAAGPNRGATNDYDGDGRSNLREYLDGTNPRRGDSYFSVTSLTPSNLTFRANPYRVYELISSTNLTLWRTNSMPAEPTNTTATVDLPPLGPRAFFKVLRVP